MSDAASPPERSESSSAKTVVIAEDESIIRMDLAEILISGADRQVVGQLAAEVRAFRPPEPYKGKGIRYADERVVLKETKKK